MIHQSSDFIVDQSVQADVCIIGAGPGGSAAAYKLSQKGLKVVILEEGSLWAPGQFTRKAGPSLKNLYQQAGQVFAQGRSFFPVMFGKGVGGGSLVNSGISFKPPAKALDRWKRVSGAQGLTVEGLKPFIDEVMQNVPIELAEDSRLGGNNLIFKKGLAELKYSGATIPRAAQGCIACASCFYGCQSGAKSSTDKNFIARSLEQGAELYTNARVVKFHSREDGEIGSVHAALVDSVTDEKRVYLTVEAKTFVLCAGSLGSPKLLLKSEMANSSGQVGKNFRCHPSVGSIGVFEEEISPQHSIMQGYYSDHFYDDEILLETFWAPPGVIAMMLGGKAGEHFQYMEKYSNLAGSGAMIRDTSSGEVRLGGSSQIEVFYDLNDEDLDRLTRAWYHSIEVMFAAGAQKVIAPTEHRSVFENWHQVKEYFNKNQRLDPDIVGEGNHGQGTCRMGVDPKTSVVDEYGHSHDVSNLWILDSSIFPDSLGVNPQITIMALALRGATRLAETLRVSRTN